MKPMPAPWPHMLVCFELEGDVYTDKVLAARAGGENDHVFSPAQHPGWCISWEPETVREVRSSSGVVLWRREAPALPVEMPEPMPGMIVEYDAAWGLVRAPVLQANQDEEGVWIVEAPRNREKRWHPAVMRRVWSAVGVLLWQRPLTEPSPT